VVQRQPRDASRDEIDLEGSHILQTEAGSASDQNNG
jgi:hypothetical protein